MNRALLPLAWLYGAGVRLRNMAFDAGLLSTVRVRVPVISVGNIVVGGVGKTPLVEHIARHCGEKGKTVGIVSRGYRRASEGVVVVSNGRVVLVDARVGGDEPVQMAMKLRDAVVVVGERRVDAAKVAIQQGAEIIILDDGFQHRYLARDLDLLVFDSSQDFSRDFLLPAGRMREPLSSARRAHLIALSHASNAMEEPLWCSAMRRWYKGTIVKFHYKPLGLFKADDQTFALPVSLHSRKVLVFSGIGRNQQFFDSVRDSGVNVSATLGFSDHHEYGEGDIRTIENRMKAGGVETCVTTEKDAIRMRAGSEPVQRFLRDRAVFCMPIEIELIEGASVLNGMIDEYLGKESPR